MNCSFLPPRHVGHALRKAGLLLTTLSAFALQPFAQQDFNHFKSLVAQGDIPADFTTSTRVKIEEDIAANRTNLSTAKERVFLEGIHRSIDQLLNSGSVIYGDEVTAYVQAVAGNLLKNQPELLAELRFYTIKSNETNALSTDQGIVFVTTGLISQLTSEAQLAYVLSHEIAHYTEKHVVESFDYKLKNRYAYDRISKLSTHSRDHEFAADKFALKLYHEAGYSEDEIVPTFDVLMYSYLPFDEVELPNSYFSTDKFYIPDNIFATKKYPIKAEEDYDDDRSSHPNIKKRKDAALEAAENYSNWGTAIFSQGESRFYYIRNLARFESVRTDIIDASFGDALYSIFLLEKEFPQSVYLKQMKALAWLGLTQFKEGNQQSKTMPNSSDYEGESAALFFFLKKLNDDAMMSLALRNVYDIRKELPNDAMVNAIMDRLVKTLAETDHFSWDNYAQKNFRESSQLALVKNDTVPAVADEKKTDAPKSKYDKIKTKKNINAPESFDSSKYYFYGLSDIIGDSSLRTAYTNYKIDYDDKQEKEEAYKKLTKKERYELEKKNKNVKQSGPLAIGMNECILVQPSVADYKHHEFNWESSEKKQLELNEVLDDVSTSLEIDMTQLDQDDIVLNGTASFNDRSALYALLEQAAHYEEIPIFPVDYEALQTMKKSYGTGNVMYTLVEHYYDANVSWAAIGYSVILLPALPFTLLGYLPVQLMRGHHTEITVLIMDASTGELKASTQQEFRNRPLRHYLGSHYYDIFNQLKKSPNE